VQLSNNAPLDRDAARAGARGDQQQRLYRRGDLDPATATARESEAPIGYTQLAMAYGRKGTLGRPNLASAQAAFLRGDNKTARDLASPGQDALCDRDPGMGES